jgi:muramoyltetrapeptide carboxypeptidase
MKLSEQLDNIKPVRLRAGDSIGIVAPSSAINVRNVSAFVKMVEEFGFHVVLGDTITTIKDKDYNSADADFRSNDLNKMLRDKSIRAIFAGAGGFGAQRTSQKIDYDAFIRDPKPIIGFSDTTFILNSLTLKTGIGTFLGPTAEVASWDADKKCVELCLRMIMGELDMPFEYFNLDGSIIRRISKKGLRGVGRLIGGNLTMMQTSLGTDYEIDTSGKILLIEEVSESSYSIERILDHLFAAGKFDDVAGVVFGEFTSIGREPLKDVQDSNPSVNEILVKKFANADFPILAGYNFSHGAWNLTFPLGSIAKMDSTNRTLSLIEQVVR